MSTASPFQNAGSIDALVGQRVHTLMWQQRIKNKDLANVLGLEPTGVGKKLRAEAKFSLEQLVAVARYLDTTVAYLVGETEKPHPGDGPDGGSESRLGESNPRPIHYMRTVFRPELIGAAA